MIHTRAAYNDSSNNKPISKQQQQNKQRGNYKTGAADPVPVRRARSRPPTSAPDGRCGSDGGVGGSASLCCAGAPLPDCCCGGDRSSASRGTCPRLRVRTWPRPCCAGGTSAGPGCGGRLPLLPCCACSLSLSGRRRRPRSAPPPAAVAAVVVPVAAEADMPASESSDGKRLSDPLPLLPYVYDAGPAGGDATTMAGAAATSSDSRGGRKSMLLLLPCRCNCATEANGGCFAATEPGLLGEPRRIIGFQHRSKHEHTSIRCTRKHSNRTTLHFQISSLRERIA